MVSLGQDCALADCVSAADHISPADSISPYSTSLPHVLKGGVGEPGKAGDRELLQPGVLPAPRHYQNPPNIFLWSLTGSCFWLVWKSASDVLYVFGLMCKYLEIHYLVMHFF